MCANFSLYYGGQPFIVNLDHFLGYVVKVNCQKRDQFSNVQSGVMRNMLNRIFHVINNRVNRNAEKFNWVCSNSVIRIKAGRIPTYKTTYFKDLKVLFDGVCERNITLMCKYAREKCYYLKIIDLFREKEVLPSKSVYKTNFCLD